MVEPIREFLPKKDTNYQTLNAALARVEQSHENQNAHENQNVGLLKKR